MWIPLCVRHCNGMADQPCWCGACEPPLSDAEIAAMEADEAEALSS